MGKISVEGIRADIDPEWSDLGVPMCTENDCREYDGKRCEVMGFRPRTICEPAVISMYELLLAARRGIEKE